MKDEDKLLNLGSLVDLIGFRRRSNQVAQCLASARVSTALLGSSLLPARQENVCDHLTALIVVGNAAFAKPNFKGFGRVFDFKISAEEATESCPDFR